MDDGAGVVSPADPAVRVHGAGLRRRAGVPGAAGAALARRVLEQEGQPRALAGVPRQAVQGELPHDTYQP